MVEDTVATAASRHRLSHAALNALAVIEGEGAPLLTGEVASRMHITSGSVTSLLDNLERKGFVVRTGDPDDRRRVLVDITPAGQATLDRLLPEVQQVTRRLFGGFDDARLQQLLDLLADVRHGVEELPAELPAAKPRRRPARLTR